MTRDEILSAYHGYIACLNARAWDDLHRFVGEGAIHNGAVIGLSGYRAMLEADVRAIPDLSFTILQTACDPPLIAVELGFDCHPRGMLFGMAVNGRRLRFRENVFYRFDEGRIVEVRSVIDKDAIRAQI